MKTKYRLLIVAIIIGIGSCGIIDPKNKGKGFNILPLSADKNFGVQTEKQIAADSKQFPILDPNQYREIYGYVIR